VIFLKVHLMVKTMLANNKGQGVVEATVLALVSMCGVLLICLSASYGLSRIWIHQSLYDGLLCMADLTPRSICTKKIRKQITGVLKWGSLNHLYFDKFNDNYTGKVKWTFNITKRKKLTPFNQFQIQFSKVIKKQDLEKVNRGF